ncbi:17275_t:CDS:2 [Dentiscutata erythropus]|uniref:17275_t:CDS:1 n=1 Tax=Dentiscutata erythropus TaxID=1348616 RepID=A0A9N9NC24_9GLOM|nr:17275_t:CDS:2 [Dentiscutata erythropus]
MWTKSLEKYFTNALDKTGKEFKLAIQEEIEGEEENRFRLYCEKVLMGLTLEFDWIEAYAQSAKIIKTNTDSGIVRVDIKGTRIGDNREIWQMEISGPPSTPTTRHTISDTKKSIQTDILNLWAS